MRNQRQNVILSYKLTHHQSNVRIWTQRYSNEQGLMMHHYVNSSNEMLRKRGYRLTPQRYLILSVIQEAEGHLSIDQITERVQKHNPYVSLSTIYRTLELLRELGLVRENRLPGEQPRYEAAEGKAHHHLVCRRCRAIIHLDDTLLGNLNEQLQEQYQFHSLTLDLVAAGYCETCWHSTQHETKSGPLRQR